MILASIGEENAGKCGVLTLSGQALGAGSSIDRLGAHERQGNCQ